MSNDFLQKFLFDHLSIKGCLVRLDVSWEEVRQRARPRELELSILGESLCAAALLTSSIKFEGIVSLQIQSAGAISLVLGQCSSKREIRGICRRATDPVPGADPLQKTILSINLEPDENGAPYQGIVSMDSISLTQALETYFQQSEQLDTRFWLAADARGCAGLMLQKMPGHEADEDEFERITLLAETLTAEELKTLEPERLLHLLFHQDTVRLFDAEPVKFGCKCSAERVAGVLHSLGREEMESLLEERAVVEVNCEYCGKDYQFDAIDIAGLFSGQAIRVDDQHGVH